jgi:hypothetical protein
VVDILGGAVSVMGHERRRSHPRGLCSTEMAREGEGDGPEGREPRGTMMMGVMGQRNHGHTLTVRLPFLSVGGLALPGPKKNWRIHPVVAGSGLKITSKRNSNPFKPEKVKLSSSQVCTYIRQTKVLPPS